MGLLRVRHEWATSLSLFTFMHWGRKWQSTPVFLPGESQRWGEPGGLPSMGSHRVRHDWSDLAAAAAEEKWSESRLVVSNSLWSHRLYSPWNPPGHNTEVGRLSLLQGIFPTTGSNPGLPHCRWILYQLSHKRSPRILEWVAYPFSSRSSWPRNWTRVSCIAGGFFTNWAIREAWLEEKGAQYPSSESGPSS